MTYSQGSELTWFFDSETRLHFSVIVKRFLQVPVRRTVRDVTYFLQDISTVLVLYQFVFTKATWVQH